ncbi:hypothetical protein ACFSB1_00895 [Halopseudomonas phragmitis]|uniref:Uncharacterized protein n=1 Tax=Halopseudomonas phragmitis TaxID=1931241 RepID=A0A1V0B6I6_9GAMM|nr:hypothetical protein [Halopseudomonas phragmitis]AQZ95535.1 hypothetical protein BVH74_12590 [Halopseudomonas phragmitis]
MAQQAIVTFTDREDGSVNVCISFDPEVNVNSPMTPAIRAAFDVFERIAKNNPEATEVSHG